MESLLPNSMVRSFNGPEDAVQLAFSCETLICFVKVQEMKIAGVFSSTNVGRTTQAHTIDTPL